MKKFDKPIRTQITWNYDVDSEISILGETEKAILVIYSFSIRRGTSKSYDTKSVEKWIPKSVWDNPRNFETYNYMGDGIETTTFKPPYFLR